VRGGKKMNNDSQVVTGLSRCLAAVVVFAGLTGCGGSAPSGTSDGGADADAGDPAGRLLGIIGTASENGVAASSYEQSCESALTQSQRANVNAVSLRWQWGEIETGASRYEDTMLDAVNQLYAGKGVQVVLGIDPLDGPVRGTPSDLDTTSFDDPGLIDRYKRLLDHVLSRLPDLDIRVLVVGNEVNMYLSETNQWQEYARFYEAVGTYARSIAPLRVGVTATGEFVMEPIYLEPMKNLNQFSDVISLTQWASYDLVAYFDLLTSEYEGRPIVIQEIGYPSSPVLGSSEEQQADFIRDVFSAWDQHASQIHGIFFFYLHDMSAEDARHWEDMICAAFPRHCGEPGVITALFSSLGLRTHPGWGNDKQAFTVLIEESRARGW
jgi:hypothetical protein